MESIFRKQPWIAGFDRPGTICAVKTNASGFDQLLQWMGDQGCTVDNTVMCMENTGIYGKRLLVALTEAGWPTAVEKTTVTDKVGPEHDRKEDEFDASLLAEYADRFADQLHITTPPEEALDQIKQLYSERRRLVRQRTATKTKQTQSTQQPHCLQLLRHGWNRQLEFLDKQIETLESRIAQIIEAHEGLCSYFTLLQSIPGVAEVTAWLWLIHFYGQPKLNPKKIASRFGVAPHTHESGSSVRGKTRSSGHGASEMRSTMTLAARSASTHYDRFKAYKQKKLDEGKCWPVVRNNLVNKLITIMCAIWNSGQPYDPDHTSRFDREKKAA
ncbi:MAG: transposase [Balneolaceae bacterium]|nr:transposase [Balneolaceae bacterium]